MRFRPRHWAAALILSVAVHAFGTAIMSERGPVALIERGAKVHHILSSGELEPHFTTMRRIADLLGMPHEDLIHSPEEIIAEAYLRRGKQMAYRRDR